MRQRNHSPDKGHCDAATKFKHYDETSRTSASLCSVSQYSLIALHGFIAFSPIHFRYAVTKLCLAMWNTSSKGIKRKLKSRKQGNGCSFTQDRCLQDNGSDQHGGAKDVSDQSQRSDETCFCEGPNDGRFFCQTLAPAQGIPSTTTLDVTSRVRRR